MENQNDTENISAADIQTEQTALITDSSKPQGAANQTVKKKWVVNPPIIKSPEEFELKMNAYIKDCKQRNVPLTIAGLANSLGFLSRISMFDYEQRNEPYSNLIKKYRMIVEQFHEESLATRSMVAGHIFWLKNHAGYSDKQDIGLSTPNGALETNSRFEIVFVKPLNPGSLIDK